ncbi:MAG: PilN domain-containing protein [Gammaproteobacteria bacterium]
MARINLLPWRDELRKQYRQEFFIGIGAAVIVTLVILGGVHMYFENRKEYQEKRNRMIQEQITLLNRKLKEIKDIEDQKSKLLAKIEVIQNLQKSRPEIVHLFDELAKTAPEGVFLTRFKQAGFNLTMNGMAQSNARISAYMRAIEASPWMQNPRLTIISADQKSSSGHSNSFTMLAVQGEKKKEQSAGGDS